MSKEQWYSERIIRTKRLRTAGVLALMLPVLALGLLAIWSPDNDLARGERYGATAFAWFFWLIPTGGGIALARDSV